MACHQLLQRRLTSPSSMVTTSLVTAANETRPAARHCGLRCTMSFSCRQHRLTLLGHDTAMLVHLLNISSHRRLQDGYYWLTGRMDDVINVSGHRIGTAEVESALVAHSKARTKSNMGADQFSWSPNGQLFPCSGEMSFLVWFSNQWSSHVKDLLMHMTSFFLSLQGCRSCCCWLPPRHQRQVGEGEVLFRGHIRSGVANQFDKLEGLFSEPHESGWVSCQQARVANLFKSISGGN